MNRYAPALWLPADATNFRKAARTTYDLVVIHITDGHPEARGTAEMFQQPHHGASAHFVVGQGGEVIQCVDLGDVAWHASQVNAHSVGVEHSARAPGEWTKLLGHSDPGLFPSELQYRASAQLVAWLLTVAGLPSDRDHIKGHCEASPRDNHDDCPNAVWDWDRYMALVADAMTKVA